MTATSADAAIETTAEQVPSVTTTTFKVLLYWYRSSLHIEINLYNFDSIHKLSDLVYFNDIIIIRKKFSSGGFWI
jgi:hypothetical protein